MANVLLDMFENEVKVGQNDALNDCDVSESLKCLENPSVSAMQISIAHKNDACTLQADEAAILVDQSRQNMMMIQMMRGGFLLLPASSTSSSSLELSMRLPRNELEITRKAIQVVLA